MSDLLQLIKNYSVKHHKKIETICSPLVDCLDIPIFTYGFIEADGRFGYLTNKIEFNEYYFSQNLHLSNPYYSDPAYFRSGHILLPCTQNEEAQKSLSKKFNADHIFLTIEANESKLEFFIFANENVDAGGGNHYLTRLNLLHKFQNYFKREAKDLIGKIRSDQFNILKERGKESFETIPSVPLASNDPKIHAFLKRVCGLSPQEIRCLEYFKQGKSAQATGALMGLSQCTVEFYFENMKNKLGCTSKYDLLNY